MILFGLILSLLFMAIPADAINLEREIRWEQLLANGLLLPSATDGSYVVTVEGATLTVTRKQEGPSTFRLAVIENPGITQPVYTLEGRIACQGVEGRGYLEMLNSFPGEKTFFSRTMGLLPIMQPLSGNQPWHKVRIPFNCQNDPARPIRIELNLVLPGGGTVLFGPFKLVEYESFGRALTTSGEWWGEQSAGWMGSILGFFGGLFGIGGGIAGMLASRGKGRSFANFLLSTMIAVGVILLLAGIVALSDSQPYHVYYPLLLGGILFSLCVIFIFPVMHRQYAQSELRRIQSMDV
jgi:hypothetical protein